jgi:ATP-binding cassette subfamily F protein 3
MATLLSATGLTKTYGRQNVLDGLGFVIPDRARIALIGRNGAGKTTLLKILIGEETADGGTVSLMPGARLGVVNQHEILPSDVTTVEFLAAASGREPWECLRLGAKFGLREGEMAKAPSMLSGGYQMRVKIVRMLLADPNLLLLDEPVNYLDLPTLLLLESFLQRWPGAFIITSHDREVLQRLATTTWEIQGGKLTPFAGDVETYLDWKEEQAEYARRSNKKLRRDVAHAQEFVDRFRFKASKASQAQSRLKYIAKLRSKLKSLATDLPTVAFKIPCPSYVDGQAMRCIDLAIGYSPAPVIARNGSDEAISPNTQKRDCFATLAMTETKPVASGINLEFPRGVKIGIVGENGRGKSTLLKTWAGLLPPLAGQAKWWSKADIGYYSQFSDDVLLPEETVLTAISRAAPANTAAERILATAGAFLFRNDDLEKSCSVLSGGERARVRLARLVLQEHNVLLLDEPTNHLDVETVEVLATALKEYPGTVVVVSHARTFMNALVERIFEVRHGTVREVPLSYEEYVAELTAAAEATDGPTSEEAANTEEAASKRERTAREKERRRERQRVEEKLAGMDREKSTILKYFFENPTEYAPEKSRRLQELEEMSNELEQRWYKLAE